MAKIDAPGRITIPKSVRDRMRLQAGDKVEFVSDERGFYLRRHVDGSPFAAYRGFLKHSAGRNPDDLIEEMRGAQAILPSQ